MNTKKKKSAKRCKSLAPMRDIMDVVYFCEYLIDNSERMNICPKSLKKMRDTVIGISKSYNELKKERDFYKLMCDTFITDKEHTIKNSGKDISPKGFFIV